MDRTHEAKVWRRSFAAGIAALLLSVGGHVAFAPPPDRCPVVGPGLVERALARLGPEIGAPVVAQRIAQAALSLFVTTCG